MTTPNVDTLSQKIITAMQPLVREEAKRIVAAKADSPEERAARREAYEINHACKRLAAAYDALMEAKTQGQRAIARQKLFAEAAKLKLIMLKHGRISAREGA